MTPAEICLNQIRQMDPRALFAWGVTRNPIIISTDGQTLTMKSAGLVHWKGFIAITYNRGSDLYDIEFYKVRKLEKKVVASSEGVFFDSLVDVIDRQVG